MSDYKMDPALKAQWLDALRSGNYRQGRGELRCNDNYCCLGVLCKIGPTEEVVGRTYDTERGHFVSYDYTFEGKSCLDSLIPESYTNMPDDIQRFLANMNDVGETFETIADWIERTL